MIDEKNYKNIDLKCQYINGNLIVTLYCCTNPLSIPLDNNSMLALISYCETDGKIVTKLGDSDLNITIFDILQILQDKNMNVDQQIIVNNDIITTGAKRMYSFRLVDEDIKSTASIPKISALPILNTDGSLIRFDYAVPAVPYEPKDNEYKCEVEGVPCPIDRK